MMQGDLSLGVDAARPRRTTNRLSAARNANQRIICALTARGVQFLRTTCRTFYIPVPHGMDHNNKHLLPGFQFPAAFAGLQNAGTNSLISTLSQFGLSTPMLNPISATDLAQWAAVQQSTQQAWLDTAKFQANLLPSFYLAANAKQIELAQQNLQSAVNGTTSSAIFPALMSQVAATKIISPPKEVAESPCAEPLSNASSSHQSSSTPQEIDVGVISTTSQTHAFDLSTKSASPAATTTESPLLCEPSTSTASSIITSTTTPKLSTSSLVPTSLCSNGVEDIDPAELLAPLFPHIKLPTTASELSATSGGAGLKSLLATSSISLPTVAASTSSVPPAGIVPKRSAAQEVEDTDEHPEFGQMFDLEKEDTGTVFGSNDGGALSPVQFTPPESPTHKVEEEEPPPSNPFSARPTPSSTPFIPAPAPTPAPPPVAEKKPPESEPFKLPTPSPVKAVRKEPFPMRPINKANKVPIYKQKKSAVYKTDDKQEKNDDCGDAYSFSDEEEHSITKIDPKEKLDAEVREKLSKYAGQAADAKNKNVYVPGVGFAVPQEQPQQDLWRNVVLKKRPMIENRPIVPSANLLPASVHAEACQVAARLAEPEIVTLAESIRRRKKARYACPFIKTEPTTSTDCVKEEGADERMAEMQKEIESQPKLPKLVIKLPKREEYKEYKEHKKKKKKKRRREEDDSDWEGSRKTKKHKKRRLSDSRRYSGGYDMRVFDEPEDIKPCLEDIKDIKPVVKEPEVPMFYKKKRLLEWQEGQNIKLENGERKYNGINGTTTVRKHSFADFNADAIKQRLSKFSQADGNITKGTFVVNKSELFRDDCALWKVDNPNMLQKFPPRIDPTTKNVSYKSSSTYSGWCEQISSGYYKVMVRFIKQTRSECIVEPDIPISDLFPAMTSECSDNNGIMQPEEELPADPNEHVNILRDQRRMDLHFIMRVMVDHALTLESIQAVKDKNDWTSIKALDFIMKLNSDCLERIRQNSTMKEEVEDILKEYHKLFIADMDSNGFICKVCQACKYEKRPVEKVIQLIGRQGYDSETLQPKDRPRICSDDDEDDEPLAAQEIYLCGSCAVAAQFFHRCHHMLFHLLMACEDKLEMLGTLHAEYKPELIVELAKKSRTWQNKLFSDILEMWKKIETMPVATVSAPAAPLVA